MAQPSKFSGALSALRASAEAQTPPTPPAAAEPASPVGEASRGRGRPPGKRSDPEFKPTTLFLRVRTKRAAGRRLEDAGDERDLSELVEDLLAQWCQRGG